MTKMKTIAHMVLLTSISTGTAFANSDIRLLKKEIRNIKNTYEKRLSDLETRLEETNTKLNSNRNILNNKFNPSVGIILNGKYQSFSKPISEMAGVAIGEEGERGKKGFSIDESEINFSSNIDDKFFGSLTAAIVREAGVDKIELEESFIQTTPGLGLPKGLSIKVGRAFWKLGYLNEHHAHSDDFSDRPLPYRAFLNKSFNDDGIEASYVLPTNFYTEIGGGVFSGNDFPLGTTGTGDGTGSYSAYLRIGGDIGYKHNWRLGGYTLSGEAQSARAANEYTINFTGKTKLYAADLRYVFAPTGNANNQEVTFQAEYFWRHEDGTYNDSGAGTGNVNFNDDNSSWYAQAVYKFKPSWRIGARYSEIVTSNTPAGLSASILNANGFDPKTISAMLDWTNSEFSRLRLQYNHEELSRNSHDNQIILQYVMSFGAHPAHKY